MRAARWLSPLIVSVLAAGLPLLAGCASEPTALSDFGGDPRRGLQALQRHGCGACHVIPGVAGATGTAGPPLTDFARRGYIAGALPNTPENLIRWIEDPQAIEPGTAMPALVLDTAEARDIAAYLYPATRR